MQNGQPWHISSDHGNTLIQEDGDGVLLKGVAPNQLTAKDFISPSQSELVSKNSLLTQFMTAGFQNTSPNGSSSAPIASSENLTTVMSDSGLAPSTPHAHV